MQTLEQTKILKFQADWCQPCKMMSAIVENLGIQVECVDVDDDENRELAAKYNIRNLPTMVAVQGDIELSRLIGAHPKNKVQDWYDDLK